MGFTCLNSVSANEPPRKCFSSINGHFQIKYFDEVYDVFFVTLCNDTKFTIVYDKDGNTIYVKEGHVEI